MKPGINRQKVIKIARSFKLNWGRAPLSGQVGEKAGHEVGSSIEFQDYRPYAPGDDVRHIDWKAYGRSDTLMIRLFREEISPRVDLIVDETSSMTVTGEKLIRLRELTMLFSISAKETRSNIRIFGKSEPQTVHDPIQIDHSPVSRLEPWNMLTGRLRWRSLRIVISDFLFPHDPSNLLRMFALNAARLYIIQLNTPEEVDPPFRGPFRFIEIEDNSELDLQVGQKEIDQYRKRFSLLRENLRRETARAHGIFCTLSTTQDIDDTAAQLVRCGIMEAL